MFHELKRMFDGIDVHRPSSIDLYVISHLLRVELFRLLACLYLEQMLLLMEMYCTVWNIRYRVASREVPMEQSVALYTMTGILIIVGDDTCSI